MGKQTLIFLVLGLSEYKSHQEIRKFGESGFLLRVSWTPAPFYWAPMDGKYLGHLKVLIG